MTPRRSRPLTAQEAIDLSFQPLGFPLGPLSPLLISHGLFALSGQRGVVGRGHLLGSKLRIAVSQPLRGVLCLLRALLSRLLPEAMGQDFIGVVRGDALLDEWLNAFISSGE